MNEAADRIVDPIRVDSMIRQRNRLIRRAVVPKPSLSPMDGSMVLQKQNPDLDGF